MNWDVRAVMTGRGTAPRHTELAGPERLQLYVSDAARAASVLAVTATQAFPNLELIETNEEGVYFDAQVDGEVVLASTLQTYLEVATGGAREVEAARALRAWLLTRTPGNVRTAPE